jgi:sulfate adenylyltransferase
MLSPKIAKKICTLTKRQLCDLECLLNGAFFPLTGFMEKHDYDSVCQTMRLSDGTLWPIPITLDVSEKFAQSLETGEQILLIDEENTPLAELTISSCWKPNKEIEAQQVFATTDKKHPAVDYLFDKAGEWYLGGKITPLSAIIHYDFIHYRHTPTELKQLFSIYGWSKIIAFQTRNPMHRAHYELTVRAAEAVNANLLLHPVVGMTKLGDVDYITRVKCYEQILGRYSKHNTQLSLLPLAMRMAGPKEAIWHGIIRKNYGVTHFIIGRDHAGPGLNSQGELFYPPYAAQTLLLQYADEIGIEPVPFPAIVYVKETSKFCPINEVKQGETIEDISGTELRKRLDKHLDIPSWFSFPEIIDVLRKAYPPKKNQGFTVFFTGLSGSGKSTLAKALLANLLESSSNNRTISLLDGDIIRKNLSSELGFSKEDRDTNIGRIGFVAAEITKHKGIAICAAIAPYAAMRQAIRSSISQYGGFIEIYVSTTVEICKRRDIKGLYEKAELGLIQGFTGVNDPYEIPSNPELVINTDTLSIAEAVLKIRSTIETLGYSISQYSKSLDYLDVTC